MAIVAGSDTTATTLSGVFYYLLSDPNRTSYMRLQAEIDAAFPLGVEDGDILDHTKLTELHYLNAVMYACICASLFFETVVVLMPILRNEALRLQPAVPTMLQRAPEKGSGGKWLGSRFVVPLV